ncbi:hypothetical protein B0H11DRAFT_1920422 [Mycena galericulata]|nr:hypothetical protein B0H11DRAFT_1920422 [Mycena galericulata]
MHWDIFKSLVLLHRRSGPLGVVGIGANDGGDSSYVNKYFSFNSGPILIIPTTQAYLGYVQVWFYSLAAPGPWALLASGLATVEMVATIGTFKAKQLSRLIAYARAA